MWKIPWKFAEGVSVCIGLVIVGAILQVCVGGVNWSHIAHPLNLYLLIFYVIALVALHIMRKRVYFVRWATSYGAVLSALFFVVGATLLMGLIRQVPSESTASHAFGLDRMLSFWPFVLLYAWMLTILGLTVLKRLNKMQWRDVPFMCNHLGLFIALLCGTLGSADIQRLTMNVRMGQTEWRAIDAQGEIHELPVAIELKSFSIDEYPPKLMIIDNATGKSLPDGKPEQMSLDDGVTNGSLADWDIQVIEKIEDAAAVFAQDSVRYVEWHNPGAAYAAHIRATSHDGTKVAEGWVSCGSFAFPYQALRIDDNCSLVMPDREPQRFLSEVEIYTQRGHRMSVDIEVNEPAEIDGWKIYQLSYDETKGRWSDLSVFELVTDPWLPAVYVGIVMMAIGAICLFIGVKRRKEEG